MLLLLLLHAGKPSTLLSRTERNGLEGRSGQQESVDCIAVGSLAFWRRQRFGLEVFVVGVVVIAPLENQVWRWAASMMGQV